MIRLSPTLLQLGIYDGVPAVTSGAGADPRDLASCPPSCGRGQLRGRSDPSYAVVRVGPRHLEAIFKDTDGRELYRWRAKEQHR